MNKSKQNIAPKTNIKEETMKGILAVIFFALASFFTLASIDIGGIAGEKIYSILSYLLGVGYFLLPIIFIFFTVSYLKMEESNLALRKIISSIVFFISGLGIIDVVFHKGGVVGEIISSPLVASFDIYASLIFLFSLLLISFLIIFDTHLRLEHFLFWKRFFVKKEKTDAEKEIEKEEIKTEPVKLKVEEPEEEPKEEKKYDVEKKSLGGIFGLGKKNPEEFDIPESEISKSFRNEFIAPPLSLLEKDKGKPEVGDIKANANIIKRTLQNFGIDVEMDEISIGPSVTRYALKPAEGVKLSRIVGLQNDLSLALAAHPLRIEAPIPGKSLVGIEIPNSTKTTVGLATLLAAKDYKTSEKPLFMSLGKDISGFSLFADLAKAPHMLIAGATGSGKSVTIHALVNSLLFRNSPRDLKFIMIDPKRVELTLYNKIPHLLTPVITDAKKAILALKWAAKEMDRRYDILETETVRDIQSYHKNVLNPALEKVGKMENIDEEKKVSLPETMPYIVVIIDELADIMQSYPRELESAIVRLAQMSRAVGIHLILSTQRPSVNVITGLIKANIPTRIALQVASQIDSRTILDMSGAEKLLGAGDMLYLSGEMSKPKRVQSAFISEKEVKKVVKFMVENYVNELNDEIDISVAENDKNLLFDSMLNEDNSADDDELYEEAREAIIEAGKASTSYLQRKLRIGYSRAARLIDMLEERGVIGHSDGAKPREVFDGKSNSAENGEIQ